MGSSNSTGLVRAIGRWSLAALLINSIVGSGIFGLPSAVAAQVGLASPWAYLIAAAGIGVIMACFAEVASQFREAGGPYLWARAAFGQFLGIQMGWLIWLVRLTGAAAAANLFTSYLAQFLPSAGHGSGRALTLTLLVGTLAAVNYRGVAGGARVSNIFVVAKLVPLGGFAIAGLLFIALRHGTTPSLLPTSAPFDKWLEACLLLVFAYGGFEGGLTPMSEARDPRHDAPFAIGISLLTTATLFTAIQYVVVHVLADPTGTDRPLAVAAEGFLGHAGASFIAVGGLLSLTGYLSSQMLHVPRLSYAMAEQGDFPAIFGAIHPRHRTPYASILFFAAVTWIVAMIGSFRWNVGLSAVGRLVAYLLVCAALPTLRIRRPQADAWRLPAGWLFAALGMGFAAVIVTRMSWQESYFLLGTAAIALLNWLAVRGRRSPGGHDASRTASANQ
jgi:APA family basic amino acid/polyamine antiporter